MQRVLFAALAVMFSLAALPAAAQNNPFGQPMQSAPKSAFPQAKPEQGRDAASPAQEGSAGWWQTLLAIQRDLQKQLTDAVRAVKTEHTLPAALLLMLVSFLYGVLHAAGPGHGKGVISSYVVANRATLRRGIVLSVLSGLVQALSAIALVGVLVLILNATGIQIREVIQRFDMASSILIALAGLWLLTVHLRRGATRKQPHHENARVAGGHDHHHADADHSHQDAGHTHQHHDTCGCGHSHVPDARVLERNLSLRQAAAIVLAVGIRPCTGAIVVLLFSLRLGILWAGIAATFVMALGTSITVSVLASLAVGSREAALWFSGSRWTERIYNFAAVAGSLLVVLIGAGLFWEALGPARPF